MTGTQFDYRRAESLDHALALLGDHPDAELLAGGQSLLARIHDGFAAPDVVVDIGEIDAMRGIEIEDGVASIGALATYADILDTQPLQKGARALTAAIARIGDTQIRNCGTLGANLVAPDPVAEPPAAAIATDATLVARSRDGDRRIDAETFFSGETTALAGDELLTHVEVPLVSDGAVGTYVKAQRRTARYSLLGVAARLHVDGVSASVASGGSSDSSDGAPGTPDSSDSPTGGTVSSARVAANGALRNGCRLNAVEDALEGNTLDPDTVAAAAADAGAGLDESAFLDTPEASAAYRAKLLRVYTERALERLTERVDGTGAD